MRTKCGWVWYEWADQQSIARWETEGGSYDSWTGDALERANIIKTGFMRWYRRYTDKVLYQGRWPGYIAGWITQLAHESAYRAGLRGEPNWPSRWSWIGSVHGQQQLHDAYMVGVTDDQTMAELARLGYLP
jgi:hypothetical protein